MKKMIFIVAMLMSAPVIAIPVYEPPAPAGMVFDHWETQRFWTVHGRDRKYVPVFVSTASPVPEPASCAMFLAGIGLISMRKRNQS